MSEDVRDDELPWYAEHANIAFLARWLADNDYEAAEVAYAVEKPWKFDGEYREAKDRQYRTAEAELS